MKADLERFQKYGLFPRYCAGLKGHIGRIEQIYKDAVDKWLDIRRSLAENGELPPGATEPKTGQPKDTENRQT